jgi:hypothetical protein
MNIWEGKTPDLPAHYFRNFFWMKDYFEIHQTISVFDYYKGAFRVWLKNKKLRFFIFLPALGVLIFGLMSILGSPKPGQASVSAIGQALFLLAFTLCFYLVGFFIILLLFRMAKPEFFKNTIYTFNHWGMHKKAGSAEYSWPWKDIVKWQETKSFFYIYLKGDDAHIILKKAIDEKEQEEFRDFLKDRFA